MTRLLISALFLVMFQGCGSPIQEESREWSADALNLDGRYFGAAFYFSNESGQIETGCVTLMSSERNRPGGLSLKRSTSTHDYYTIGGTEFKVRNDEVMVFFEGKQETIKGPISKSELENALLDLADALAE